MDISFRHAGIVAAFGILVLFYAAVGAMVLRPQVDEDYRRTYLTREFGVYPPSAFFKGGTGWTTFLGTSSIYPSRRPASISTASTGSGAARRARCWTVASGGSTCT